jgi:hypothetical protein
MSSASLSAGRELVLGNPALGFGGPLSRSRALRDARGPAPTASRPPAALPRRASRRRGGEIGDGHLQRVGKGQTQAGKRPRKANRRLFASCLPSPADLAAAALTGPGFFPTPDVPARENGFALRAMPPPPQETPGAKEDDRHRTPGHAGDHRPVHLGPPGRTDERGRECPGFGRPIRGRSEAPSPCRAPRAPSASRARKRGRRC